MLISSLQNSKIKQVVALQQKSSERRKEGLFVVEGRREIMHCAQQGFVLRTLFYNLELAGDNASFVLGMTAEASEAYEVTPDVYAKMAYREGTEGMIAIVEEKAMTLNDLHLSETPLIIVLESVEKPGNLGAVLRSSDAAKADAVIVCDPLTDLHNPNLIRSSIGAVFTVPCVACSSEECIEFLKRNQIQILTAQLQDSELYYDSDMTVPTAIVMGTESTGLSEQWRQAADRHIRIPMNGMLDSLNVSVSTAILLFEAVRQRRV